MSDESKVVDISSAYQKKLRKQHEEHPGSVFLLDEYEYNGMVGISVPEEGPGVIQGQVMAILDVESGHGVVMNPEDAEKLGMALIQAAGNARFEAHLDEEEDDE